MPRSWRPFGSSSVGSVIDRPSGPEDERLADVLPVRVVYVIGSLGKGGAEYQLYELIRHLDRKRFTPSVVSLSSGGHWAEPLRELGVDVIEIPKRRRMEIARLRKLRDVMRQLRPTILHTVLWSGNVYGRLATIGLGIPIVIAAERNVIRRPAWQRALERGLDRVTTLYLTNADAIVEELAGHGGLPRSKMRVVANGIDLSRLPPFTTDRREARRRLGWPADRRLVSQVGRLEAQKDYPTFVRAMAEIAPRFPDVDFLIVGDGSARSAIEDLVRELGLLGRVRLLGLRHDVPEILAATDVLVLASRWEGLPNVVIEGMATGAAVVATDVGGARMLLRDGAGRLAPVGATAAIAAEVEDLLGDDAARVELVSRARRRIESDLTTTRMAAETTAVYSELLGKGA